MKPLSGYPNVYCLTQESDIEIQYLVFILVLVNCIEVTKFS